MEISVFQIHTNKIPECYSFKTDLIHFEMDVKMMHINHDAYRKCTNLVRDAVSSKPRFHESPTNQIQLEFERRKRQSMVGSILDGM